MIFNYNGSEHFNVYPGSHHDVSPDTQSGLGAGSVTNERTALCTSRPISSQEKQVRKTDSSGKIDWH